MMTPENYWFGELTGKGPASALRECTVHSLEATGNVCFETNLPEELIARVGSITKNSVYGIHIFFMGALHLAVRRYQVENNVIIATPPFRDANRPATAPCVYITSQPEDEIPVRSFLNAVREKVLNAYQAQNYDLAALRENIRQKNLPDITKGPAISFSYNEVQDDMPSDIGSPIRIMLKKGTVSHTIQFVFRNNFIPGFTGQFWQHYLQLLNLIADNLDLSIGELLAKTTVVHAREEQELHPLPQNTLLELFRKNVALWPDAVAVRHLEKSVTYSALNERAGFLAASLKKTYKLQQGEVVAISAAADINFLTCSLGIMKAGGIVLAVENTQPDERIAFLLADSQAQLMLADRDLQFETTAVLRITSDLFEGSEENGYVQYDSMQTDANSPAFIIYTSGSTGNPKGVLLNHTNLINQFVWFKDYFAFTPDDVLPQKSSINFIDSLTELYLPITICPGIVYLRPYDDINKNTKSLMEWFKGIGTTILLYVPSLFEFFAGEEDPNQLHTLKHLVLGGEEIKRLYTYPFATYNLYGNSECASISSIYLLQSTKDFYKIPIGKPIYNTGMYILDRHLNKVPSFVIGEIYIAGTGVSLGYINNPGMTNEKFLPDPFEKKGVMYKTGDYGRMLPDGNIEYIGRKDRQVKIRGIRIDTEEIENKIREQLEVSDIAVIARGEEYEKYLAAVCVFKKSSPGLTEAAIKQRLLTVLPVYLVPVEILVLDSMPLTPSGKIDRKALPELLNSQRIKDHAPANSTEKELLDMWKKILKKEEISTVDNFFTVGGHSLNMIQVLYRIKNKYKVSIHLNSFIKAPTIREMAAVIEEKLALEGNDSMRHDLVAMNRMSVGKPNLIMLHPFNGFAVYNLLGRQLEGKINVLGLHAPGLFGLTETLPGTFEETAKLYAQRIIKHGLQGDLCLCGYSSSVPLVFEITKELERAGVVVKKLILVDDYFKAATRVMGQSDKEMLLNSELIHAAAIYFSMNKDLLLPLKKFNTERVYQTYQQEKTQDALVTYEEFEKYINIISQLFWLQMQYRPHGTVAADVDYLFTEKYGSNDAWKPYTTGIFMSKLLQGEHSNVFQSEHIAVNSRVVMETIEEQRMIMHE